MESRYWSRYWRDRRSSRRRFIGTTGALGAGAAGFALVGCGDDDDDDDGDNGGSTPSGSTTEPAGSATAGTGPTTGGNTGGEPQHGGVFLSGMAGSPRSLDPHFDTFPYCTAIVTNTNNGVLRWNKELTEVQTDLAESLPEQPDDMTYTFKIREGVKFHDVPPANGRVLTSEDIKYSIERQMTDEPGKFQHAYYFLGQIASIETPDDQTVTFKTNTPFAPFINYMAQPWTLVIDRATVEEFGDLTEHAVGTGPYIFDSWEKEVKFELRRNPDYWDQPLPYPDAMTVFVAPNPDTLTTLFTQGDIDACVLGINQRDQATDARPEAAYQSVPSQFWKQFRMPPTTEDKPYQAPFDDIRFREAICHAIDPQQVLDFVFSGDGIVTNGPILPIYSTWALEEQLVPFDVDKAKSLMQEAGVPDFTGPMIWATGSTEADQVAEVIKEQLAAINVTVELTPLELAQYYNQTYAYDYVFSHHTPLNSPEPDENLSSYFGRTSTYYKFYDPDIWDLIDKQRTTLDQEARVEAVKEAQRAIVQAYPMRFMYTTNLHEFVGAKIKDWFYSTDLYDGRVYTAWIDQNA